MTADLIELGIKNGILSRIDERNFPFIHYLIPESVKQEWVGKVKETREIMGVEVREFLSTFPDTWLSPDMQMVTAPIFAVSEKDGRVLQPFLESVDPVTTKKDAAKSGILMETVKVRPQKIHVVHNLQVLEQAVSESA